MSAFHRERLGLYQPLVPEIPRENAQPISALLRLAAIWIENSQPEVTGFASERAHQDAIRSDTVMAVADQLDTSFVKIVFRFGKRYDQIVISKCVVFCIFHLLISSVGITCCNGAYWDNLHMHPSVRLFSIYLAQKASVTSQRSGVSKSFTLARIPSEMLP